MRFSVGGPIRSEQRGIADVRIMVVSNLYPPHHLGGYELGCRDVVERLRRRGQEVVVLTSAYGVGKPGVEEHVFRWLRSDWEWSANGSASYVRELFKQEWINQRAFRELARAFRPDLVYVWNLTHVSLSLVALAEEMDLRLAYYVSDDWLAQWSPERQRWFQFWVRRPDTAGGRLTRPLLWAAAYAMRLVTGEEFGAGERRLDYRNAQFASRYLLDSARVATGGPYPGWAVIHWGVDAERFTPAMGHQPQRARLLYVGQVMPHKGVHTAVEALRILRHELGRPDATLDVFGSSTDPGYVDTVRRAIAEAGLEGIARLRGPVARDSLPQVYRERDVLIFPSVWNEPFSITLLEAMASGVPVVATLTGGTGEILRPESNALTFDIEDARTCASQIARLFADRDLRCELRTNARATIVERFTIERMIDAIEAALQSAVSRS